MQMGIYAIRDAKAEAYLQPWFDRTHETAARSIEGAIGTDENFTRYAEDYSLWCIGAWDDATGEIVGTPPRHLVNFVDIRDKMMARQRHQAESYHEENQPTAMRVDAAVNDETGEIDSLRAVPQGGE